MEITKIGAAYIRVSDERQDEYSPDSQLKKIREYADKEGSMIPDEFVFYDDGISGKSVAKRNDFNRMIAMSKEKSRPFETIYVWKFSRFARNQEEAMVYKNLLRKNGVSVVSVSEPIPEGHFGSLIERIIEWTDEYYIVNLGVEVMRGMTEKASRGEPICAPPFGYIMRDGKYYPDEESGKAAVVREVFSLYASGAKQKELAVMLGQRGFRTRQGNLPNNRLVDYMLHNPVYIGKIRWCPDGTRSVSKRKLDNDSIMVIDGHHEPLISTELWDKVQTMLEQQKKMYPKYARREQKIDHLLKGIVRCSSCGGTLTIGGFSSGKAKTRCLQCCNYSRGSCHTSHCITITRIEEAFAVGLKNAVGEKQFTLSPVTQKNSDPNVVDYDKLIAAEERRLQRAREAYLAEVDTIEQYAKNKKEISLRIKDLQKKKAKQVDKYFDPDSFSKKVAGVVEIIDRDDVSITQKNEVIRTVVDKVVYDKAAENLSIYFKDL